MNTEDRKRIEAEVALEFGELEDAALSSGPGIAAALRLFGDSEDAMKQADTYLGFLNPPPLVSTSDRSDF